MSWWIRLSVQVDGNEIELRSWNHTHNTNHCFYDVLPEGWGFEQWKGTSATKLADDLEAVCRAIETDGDALRAQDPSNGWGSTDGLREVLMEIIAECRNFPSASVSVSY